MKTENFKLKTLRKPRIDYPEFVASDCNSLEQMQIILKLRDMTDFYLRNGIYDFVYPEVNTKLTSKYTVDWLFEVYKMKKSILGNTKYKINHRIVPTLTRQANQVLLLAMIYSKIEIVRYFLDNRVINVNQSIFGSQFWPSYFLLACTCSDEVFQLFKIQKIRYNVGWNGLTPFLISTYKSRSLLKASYLDFITYKQYKMLLQFRSIKIVESFDELPIFSLDFACMNRDRSLIKEILETVPEAGTLSRLSFILQNEENLFLILSRYDFRESQSFNGETPLHLCCYSGDLCALSLLLNLGFPILQNYDMKWPHEVGNERTRDKSTVFFNLCTTDGPSNSKVVRKIFNQKNFEEKMLQWMEVLKFNSKDYEKYSGIFRYIKFNKSHKITTNSRFNIINLFTMGKTPVEVEYYIKRMGQYPFYEKPYVDDDKTRKEYLSLLGIFDVC